MLRPSYSALLLFLLPALIVLILAAFLNVATLTEYSHVQQDNQEDVKKIVDELKQTIGFIESVGQQYNLLNQLLEQTNQGALSHAAAYRIHSHMVDELAETDQNLNVLRQHLDSLHLPNLDLNQWQESFINFKNFSLMASDIVAIDPQTSKSYIQSAQAEYFKFVYQSNLLSNTLSEYTDTTMEHANQRIQKALNSIYYLGFAGFALALVVALFSTSRLTRYLQIILSSLHELANMKQEVPRLEAVDRMIRQTKGELRLLGESVLKFKESLLLNQKEEQRIFHLAFFDELTGLPNIQMLNKDLEEELEKARREGLKGVLIKLNINRFKMFNNALGYSFGDEILTDFAKRLCQFSDYDSKCYRGSADEFFILIRPIVILHDQRKMLLDTLSAKLQELVARPFKIKQESFSLTCNLGLVAFPGSSHDSAQDVIRNAMIALHKSKEFGSSQNVIYQAELSQQISDYFTLEKDLEKAIDENALEFYLQSQIHPYDGIARAEALIRWKHPTRGWVAPDLFIPLAEQSNLIIAIDKWMLSQVCTFLAEQKQQDKIFRISVNLSGHHLLHPGFMDNLQTIFNQTGVDPQQLTLEVTENVFLSDYEAVINKMQRLKQLGVHFSIDDFGTGYSSLSYLKRLPVDEIKIDRSFIQNITHKQEDLTLVKAMFELADTFGLDVVVEGVETQEQEIILQQLGTPIIQGYLYARPIPHQMWLDTHPST